MTNAPLDETHDPALTSWVSTANEADCEFPIQNLPLGRFHADGSAGDLVCGTRIGDRVLDLGIAASLLTATPQEHAWLDLLGRGDSNTFLALGAAPRRGLRRLLSRALSAQHGNAQLLAPALRPAHSMRNALPLAIGCYSDFYASIHHATAVGRLFRPDQPLLPNYQWVPIGYHGRATSIGVSSTNVVRPRGQLRAATDPPALLPTRRLDYELELGIIVGCGNPLGQPMTMDEAEQSIAGFVLLNDWSARDIQAWEYQPLGPFLSKSFATTISPWLITPEALAPFRRPFSRDAADPQPLPHLDSATNRARGSLGLDLQVFIETDAMRRTARPPTRLSGAAFEEAAYWTPAQLLAHHTSNGCNLQAGDLLGTGTLSGPRADQAGSLLELTAGGKSAIALGHGEERRFLEDGDAVILRAQCHRAGFRSIGFGECRATVLPCTPLR